MARDEQVRAEGNNHLAAQISSLRKKVADQINASHADEAARRSALHYYMLRPAHIVRNDPFPTRAEFEALLARLAAAEAEIEKLKMGRGPEPEGVL